ncbi:glutathione transferase GstA [Xylophilus sp. GW821-FHT01B05]
MKLYYSPGACSLSPHIALLEAGLAFQAVPASTKTHQLPDGSDYYAINPLGYVPLLELDDGTRLREGAVIVQYIADQVPTKNLAPANGTLARYRLQEWLNFIGTELHKGFSPLFNPAIPEDVKLATRSKITGRLGFVNSALEGKDYLAGDSFSVADGYLFTVVNWSGKMGVDLSALPHVVAHHARVAARPAVQAALKAEGLLK